MQHAADPASLRNLVDIVEPDALSTWWPLAPGWWAVLGVVAIVVLVLAVRALRVYYRNAYRRYALRLIRDATDIQSIAVILKRVAIAAYGRDAVANLSGEAWVAWLASHGGVALPDDASSALAGGPYQRDSVAIDPVRSFAHTWITCHSPPATRH
jgi:hypothetical protein